MAGGYQTWPLIQFSVIGEAWRLYKRHWFVWSLAMLIAMTGYSIVTGGYALVLTYAASHRPWRLPPVPHAGGRLACHSWSRPSSAAFFWAA